VVTRDVPPYAIFAGTPARSIGSRFDPAIVERLLKWSWWDLPEHELKRLKPIVSAGERWQDHWHLQNSPELEQTRT
jgi:hypothetical protein